MAPIIRIFLRYATFPLLYFGLITENEAADIIAEPEIAQWVSLGLGMVAPVISESWWWFARKFGWDR